MTPLRHHQSAMGGFNRFHEAAEIARVSSPCYLKLEPGPTEDGIYAPWRTEEENVHLVREKVRYAPIVGELIGRLAPDIIRFSCTKGLDLTGAA